MWPDRVSNPGPLALELDMLPTALLGPATSSENMVPVVYLQTRLWVLTLMPSQCAKLHRVWMF